MPPDALTSHLALVVGVTGHRDIAPEDVMPLRRAFGSVLEELARTCPHSPIVVLSGLAAGADSLAAREAIARGVAVFACLPMPVMEYEKDFSAQELAEFRELLASCARVFVTSPQRENGYVATGRFIARYSHLLVAFWDGSSSRGPGGTADVVSMRLTGVATDARVDDIPYLPDIGPVYSIVTPRRSAHRPSGAYEAKQLYPSVFAVHEDARATFEEHLHAMDTYNADLSATPVPDVTGMQAVLEHTDAAANRLQRRTMLFQRLLLACTFAAASVQIVQHFASIWKIVGLALALLVYWFARRHNYENRYQDYRAIAEGLRVQSAWYCAGLVDKLVDAAYLRMQEGALQWIRMALRYFYLVFCESQAMPDAPELHPVCLDWVRSQWRYYYRASRREALLSAIFNRVVKAAFVLAIACFIGTFAFLAHEGGSHLFCAFFGGKSCPSEPFFQNFLTVPIAMAALLAAIFTQYEEKQSLLANARRYDSMFHVFDRARRKLLRIDRGEAGDSKEIVYELGCAALAEHADWLIMRRDRPLKVQVA